MEGTTPTAASEFSSETESQTAESESATQAEAAATSFSAGTTTQALVTSATRPATTTRPAAIAQTAEPTTQSTTTTRNSAPTTTTTAAPTAPPATQPPKPVYAEADYAAIIATVRAYAEGKTKVKFFWDTSLTMENAGFHGTPNLTRYGTASVLDDLKYHCDLTEEMVSGGNGGVPSSEVHYNVCWFVDQNNIWGAGNGDILFVLVYG